MFNGGQGTKLFSPDSIDFLVPQSDGNLVLYNVALYRTYGPTKAAAVWAANSNGGGKGPYTLIMQQVGLAVHLQPALLLVADVQCLSCIGRQRCAARRGSSG
jgi:hypothetical protein